MKWLFLAALATGGILAVRAAKAEEGATVSISTKLTEAQVRELAQQTVRQYFPQVDPEMLVAMAKIESSFDPLAYRFEKHLDDASAGLMQTLESTALWLFNDMGAKAKGRPTMASLMQPDVSMYFGAAYVNWLRRYRNQPRGEEWIVRAYNGGPAWETANPVAKGMTANHWRKYQLARYGVVA